MVDPKLGRAFQRLPCLFSNELTHLLGIHGSCLLEGLEKNPSGIINESSIGIRWKPVFFDMCLYKGFPYLRKLFVEVSGVPVVIGETVDIFRCVWRNAHSHIIQGPGIDKEA